MEILQLILVYITVGSAFGYVVKKFFLPKALFATKKANTKACGQNDCGYH